MSNRMSPFAALTGAEKQMKWLEYQSIRLPYVHSDVVDVIGEEKVESKAVQAEPPKAQAESPKAAANTMPQAAQKAQRMTQAEAQKTRHHQYDAVIARMKQAESKTNNQYMPFS
ncbi:MAG: hypothetical protein RR865_02155 [Clostridia bacterium]